jgi:small subunit ribosomal protein S6
MTKKYELIYVLDGTLSGEELKAQMARIHALVEARADITDTIEWGRRRLAYEIQDLREGFYVIVRFEATPEVPRELERLLRIIDFVLRYLITVNETDFMPAGCRSIDDEVAEAAEKAADEMAAFEAAAEKAADAAEAEDAEDVTDAEDISEAVETPESDDTPEPAPAETPAPEAEEAPVLDDAANEAPEADAEA